MSANRQRCEFFSFGYDPNECLPKATPERKSRLILSDENHQTIYQDYNGFLVYPGGKLELGEAYGKAAAREASEELGLDIYDVERKGLLHVCHVKNYSEDYLHYNKENSQHLVETHYYRLEIDDVTKIPNSPPIPSENESKYALKNCIADIREMPQIIEEHKTDNPRWEFMKREMAAATFAFLNLYNDK